MIDCRRVLVTQTGDVHNASSHVLFVSGVSVEEVSLDRPCVFHSTHRTFDALHIRTLGSSMSFRFPEDA